MVQMDETLRPNFCMTMRTRVHSILIKWDFGLCNCEGCKMVVRSLWFIVASGSLLYVCVHHSCFFFTPSSFYCVHIWVLYIFTVYCLYDVQELVIEKETRIRESMLMMGLRQWVLWASWFIKQLLFMFVWVVAYTILFKVIIQYTLVYTLVSC